MSTQKYKLSRAVDKVFQMPNNIDITSGGTMTPSKNIFMSGQPVSEGSGGKSRHWIILFICELCFGIAIIWLYLGMRGIMRLGGFVASGGPYHIAHQAPDWVWMVFVSVFLGIIAVFVSFFATKRIGGPNLMFLAWSALFLSLGWNFMEFGFNPPMGDGLAWGWIIPGLCFIPMGAIPLLLILFGVRKHFRSRRELQSQAEARAESLPKQTPWFPSLVFQLVAVGMGIYLGMGFFNAQVKPDTSNSKIEKQKTVGKRTSKKPSYHGSSVEFNNGGRVLTLMGLPDGSWDIVFEGEVYERISELPRDAQKLFRESLEKVEGVKK
jgi:hypothetical protein